MGVRFYKISVLAFLVVLAGGCAMENGVDFASGSGQGVYSPYRSPYADMGYDPNAVKALWAEENATGSEEGAEEKRYQIASVQGSDFEEQGRIENIEGIDSFFEPLFPDHKIVTTRIEIRLKRVPITTEQIPPGDVRVHLFDDPIENYPVFAPVSHSGNRVSSDMSSLPEEMGPDVPLPIGPDGRLVAYP